MNERKKCYSCKSCGINLAKWIGQCNACGSWNTIVELTISRNLAHSNWSGQRNEVKPLKSIDVEISPRLTTWSSEMDRVLGGGLVLGSVVLIGGDPGIGKSTILLQTLSHVAKKISVLYVTGEESISQVAIRARRLELPQDHLRVMTETCAENIIMTFKNEKPRVVVIDSIQTIFTQQLKSAPGGVPQVRESTALLLRYAKENDMAIFLSGHVTKEGSLAGPRILEHMVDTVLYFEGEANGHFRLLRTVKNRFGPINEIGVFTITNTGLKEAPNPSAIFLNRTPATQVPGSLIMATLEGARPMLVEVQALVHTTYSSIPRRVTLGLEPNRLVMLLTVLSRHGNIAIHEKDVFLNVVGGIKLIDTASDLALVIAVVSSLLNQPLAYDSIVFGEIGLLGEVRPVFGAQERLKEAIKHGFKRAIIPSDNAPEKNESLNLEIIKISTLQQALDFLFN